MKWTMGARISAALVLVALGTLLLIWLRVILGPLCIAALLGYILSPVAKWIQKRGVRQWHWAVVITYALFLMIIAGAATLLGPIVAQQSAVVASELQFLLSDLANSPDLTLFEVKIPTADLISQFTSSISVDPNQAFRVLRAASTNVGWVLITLFSAFYFLKDGERIEPLMIQLAPEDFQDDFGRLLTKINDIWRVYLNGQLLLMIVMGVVTGIGLSLLGIESALTLGIITGALDIIPSVGPGIASLAAMGVAAVEGSHRIPLPNVAIVILVFFFCGFAQTAENIWLRPRIMGSRLNLHPAVVFVSIIVSLALSGVLLALFIIPIISSTQVILAYLRHRIYGTDPWEDQ